MNRNWVEIDDDSHETYNANSQIKFECSMLRSSLCAYSDAYILVSATITVPNRAATANPNNRKSIIMKNCSPFTDCTSEINNTHIDNAKDKDIVMPMYNLKQYSDKHSKTSGTLSKF